MCGKIRKRAKGRSGFTLAETLVALLILLMVTSIVAVGIPVAASVYSKQITAANAQVLLSTTMTCLRDELGTARDVSVDLTSISYTNQNGSKSVIYLGASGVYIREYADVAGSADYSRLLVSEAASNKGLRVTYSIDGYSDGVLTFSDLEVKDGDRTVVGIDEFKVRVISDIS